MRAIILRAIEDYNSQGELKEEAIRYFYGLQPEKSDRESGWKSGRSSARGLIRGHLTIVSDDSVSGFNDSGSDSSGQIDGGRNDADDNAAAGNDDDEYIFSFAAICRHLGLDPVKTREAIMNATHKISTRRRAA
jgi:hypothetical protein